MPSIATTASYGQQAAALTSLSPVELNGGGGLFPCIFLSFECTKLSYSNSRRADLHQGGAGVLICPNLLKNQALRGPSRPETYSLCSLHAHSCTVLHMLAHPKSPLISMT